MAGRVLGKNVDGMERDDGDGRQGQEDEGDSV